MKSIRKDQLEMLTMWQIMINVGDGGFVSAGLVQPGVCDGGCYRRSG